jgi:hypothetical protein
MYKICFQSKNITKLGPGLGRTSNSPVIYGFDMLWLKNTLVDWLIMVNRVSPFHHMLHQCLSFSHEGFLAVPAFLNIFKRIHMGIITLLIPLRRQWAFNRVPRCPAYLQFGNRDVDLNKASRSCTPQRCQSERREIRGELYEKHGRKSPQTALIYYFCGITWVYFRI